MKRLAIIAFFNILFLSGVFTSGAQPASITWSTSGKSYYRVDQGELVEIQLPANQKSTILSKLQLTPRGQSNPLAISSYSFSEDKNQILIYTNTKRVWRINTRGDYWVFNKTSGSLTQVGASLPTSSLMFAKFSPDGSKVAYVSDYNIYSEELGSGKITKLTKDGNRKYIYGTFDWVYEEEFACRDGIRWSPDSKSIAFWHIDASDTKDFYMINTTASVYSEIIPVEYPKVGESPSACRIGNIDIESGDTKYFNVEGDPRQHYIVRMEYIPGTKDVLIQQLNRKQNESKLIRINTQTDVSTVIHSESDEAWVDVESSENSYAVDFRHKFDWILGGKEFIWSSEKDGWRHLYRVSVDGKKDQLITPGNFDVMGLKGVDEKAGMVYILASPDNATQQYLFKMKWDGKGKPERLSPASQSGTHNYTMSPGGQFAQHSFSNSYTRPLSELISMSTNKSVVEREGIEDKIQNSQMEKTVEFFKVTTEEGVEMDGWMVKPKNFDASKKYPVLFQVYTEPAAQTVVDRFGIGRNRLYGGDMREEGYIYISIDNRGTPAPKGREWRKSIYRKIGIINIRDQALAAKKYWNGHLLIPSVLPCGVGAVEGRLHLISCFSFRKFIKPELQ